MTTQNEIEQEARTRIQKIVFDFFKVDSLEIQNRIIEATKTGDAGRDFTFKQCMAYAILTVFHENPAFFLIGVFCITFVLPTLLILKLFD